jgi:hypothetical protein
MIESEEFGPVRLAAFVRLLRRKEPPAGLPIAARIG